MDKIEGTVRLPDGARPLQEYARYYTFGEDGRVEAIYTTVVEPDYDTLNLPAGKRRWVSDPRHMPGISDGGCDIVEIDFNATNGKFEHVECNGRA